jgi:non-specific serine/threonine protein kinase
LVDKSMLVAETGPDGPRYRMLEVVRQFAHSRLEAAGETSETQARHAGFYHDLVPEARVWGGPEQLVWLDRIEADNGNVRIALGWYLGEGWEPRRALTMAGPLWWFWYMRGLLGEGRAWLQRALAAAPAEATSERALALRAVAALARIMGDAPEAVRQSEESLALYRALGDERGVAAALNSLCVNCMASGDLASARRYGEESLAAIEGLGEPQGMATSRNNLGLVTRIEGDLDRAGALFEAARMGWKATGDRRGMAAALTNLAIVARRRGETGSVRALAVEALTIYNEMGFDEGKLDCLEVLAAQEADEGRGKIALQLLTVTARMRDTLSAPLFVADEQAQRVDAEQRARMLLGDATADGIVITADELSLAEAVDSVLGAGVLNEGVDVEHAARKPARPR